MRLAIISDIHGNKNALDVVLRDIESQKVDKTICAGDFIDPLPESREVWQILKNKSIPMIRGNHEDYVISVFKEGPDSQFNADENWKPVRATAKLFSRADIDEIATYPLKIQIEDILICHASPSSNKKGWKKGIDQELSDDISRENVKAIACGHWHHIQEDKFRNKKLFMIGSVGVPLHGKPEAEYSILEKRNGEWTAEHRYVPYDYSGTVKKFVESGLVAEGAPLSWLLLDEIVSAERKISSFIAWKNSSPSLQQLSWREAVEQYFKKIGRWDQLKHTAKI